MSEEIPIDTWVIRGSSVIGTSHIKLGKPCQDAHLWRQLANGDVLLAISDGAGSATHSELGARLAVESVVTKLEQSLATAMQLKESDMREAFNFAREEIVNYSSVHAIDLRELACTLCVLVASGGRTIQGTIGDSGAVICSLDNKLICLVPPQKGEYVNETYFLTGNAWESNFKSATLECPPKGIILATDGLMDFLIRNKELEVSYITNLFRLIDCTNDRRITTERLSEFIRAKICSQTDDDVTLVLCWQRFS